MKEEDGYKYEGDLKDGLAHGQGTFTWGPGPNFGDRYIGEHKNDCQHGQGAYIWADGTIEEGKWENNEYIDTKN